ncbi:MAG: asparagine synthase (glutamine-hydrolyzing), partial [Tepidisphaeraceae bacterium]
MCGIAGVIAWDEKYRVSRDLLLRMSASLAHRGPDGEGIFLTRENEPITPETPQCGFAFRRLAIIDPDPRSMQPFTIGHLTLVFNGEIYNYRELRSELTTLRPDYYWRTQGDVEVLLMSYQAWGEKCVEHLNGMFAFAAWDERGKSLFLARDRMGQKPLYIVPLGREGTAFASEPAALGRTPWLDRAFAPERLATYLRYGCNAHGACEPMVALNPGYTLYLTHQHFDEARYFQPVSDSPEQHTPQSTRDRIEVAVGRQLVADVPLGVFLSGGVDSSVIALCARKYGPVRTFSIKFDDPRYDESRYANEVAAHLGTAHQEFCVRPRVADDLSQLAAVLGEPFGDSSALPTSYLSRQTRQQVKVALSGDGGDELFGGYDRYRAMHLARRLRSLPSFISSIAKSWTSGHPKSRLTRAARFASSLRLDDASRYDSYTRIFDDELIVELMGEPIPQRCCGVAQVFERELERTGDPVRAALATDRVTYLPDDLLAKVDRCSMMHGLEVRSPFMDHELVQFAAGLTTDQLLKGGPKQMLREAFAKDLPDFVFKRKKMGFAVPIGEWFRDSLRPMLRENLFASDSFGRNHFNMKAVERLVDEHEQFRVDHSQRLYALLMLELWWR